MYKYWFVEWDSVVGPSSISICWEKCQISLKSLFYQILHISEPNTALVNVGGQRFTRAGKDHGISKMDGSIFLFCFCFSFFFFNAVICLADSSLPQNAKALKCLQNLFSEKSQKGKRRSSGIEGFTNTFYSLLNGKGADTPLCKGLASVCEMTLNMWSSLTSPEVL